MNAQTQIIILVRDDQIYGEHVHGTINRFSFRVAYDWSGRAIRFFVFPEDKEFDLEDEFEMSWEKADNKPLIAFLERVIPRTWEATKLVEAVIREADNKGYFEWVVTDFGKFYYLEDEDPDQPDHNLFTGDRFYSIRKWITNYFFLGLECPELVVEATDDTLMNYEPEVIVRADVRAHT
jgi:hypothetical protein